MEFKRQQNKQNIMFLLSHYWILLWDFFTSSLQVHSFLWGVSAHNLTSPMLLVCLVQGFLVWKAYVIVLLEYHFWISNSTLLGSLCFLLTLEIGNFQQNPNNIDELLLRFIQEKQSFSSVPVIFSISTDLYYNHCYLIPTHFSKTKPRSLPNLPHPNLCLQPFRNYRDHINFYLVIVIFNWLDNATSNTVPKANTNMWHG